MILLMYLDSSIARYQQLYQQPHSPKPCFRLSAHADRLAPTTEPGQAGRRHGGERSCSSLAERRMVGRLKRARSRGLYTEPRDETPTLEELGRRVRKLRALGCAGCGEHVRWVERARSGSQRLRRSRNLIPSNARPNGATDQNCESKSIFV